MVGVEIVVAVVAVVVLVAIVALVLRRRGSDEVHSVEGYRQTLDTLHDMQVRSSSVRFVGGTGPPPPTRPPVAGADGEGAPGAEGNPLRFEDHSLAATPRTERIAQRQRDRAIASMNHRPRRIGALVLAGLVGIVIVGALFVAGTHHHNGATTTTAAGAHSATSTTAAGAHSATTTTVRHGRRPRTTTTTVPTSFTAVTTTATSALYVPPASSYTLTLVATSGNCWVLVESTATGKTLYTGTLVPGTPQAVSATGESKITVGAPSAFSVVLDGEPVIMPSSVQSPFEITFLPATTTSTTAAASTGATGTTASTVAP